VPTYKLVVMYDGSRFAGWQIQPGLPTVQGEIAGLLKRICDEPGLRVAGAARTDAGTHALGQVATFTSSRTWETARLHRALNRLLPSDIAVASAEEVDGSFHARRSAAGRVYLYRIACTPVLSPFLARWVHHYRRPLDVESMRRGASQLLGEHDFSSFRAAGDTSATPVKTIRRIEIADREGVVELTVEGTSFLQHMVRAIAGTLLEIGRGHWKASRMETILKARDRGKAGPTLPARGLCLVEVLYPETGGRRSLPGAENR
jgi:tRNA pseudouridine38-40 synthase